MLNVERLQPCEYGVTDPATGMAKECGEPASWRFGWSEPGFPDSIQLCEGHARKVRHDYQSGNYPVVAGR